MYYLIGDDGQIYGPVDQQTVLGWIAEGRTNGESRLRRGDTGEWLKATAFAEFASALAAQSASYNAASGPMPFSPVRAKTSGFAVWGFVLSLLGVLTCPCGILSLIALILSAMGWVRINNHPGMRGKGWAVTGCVLAFLTLVLFVIFWGIISLADPATMFDD